MDTGRALHSWTSLLTGELIAECRMRNLQELVGGNGLYSVPLASKLLFIFDSGEFMLNPTQKDIQELQKEFEDDARERAKEIALSEKLDNELLKKREAGEIGVSHGTDNYVSFLMIGLALFVSLILLLTTFGTPHI